MDDDLGLPAPDKVSFEIFTLANYAEVQNGLLYISGGGWTVHWRGKREDGQPVSSRLMMALMVRIPWNETNRQHRFHLEVVELDGAEPLSKADGQLQTGRPIGLPVGTAQHPAMTLGFEVTFPKEGSYVVRGTLNDDPGSLRQWEFQVHDARPQG